MLAQIKPLKRFGQNYLVDKNIIRKILNTFEPKKEDTIIEIGPGTGALTRELYKQVINFTAIEIDTRVIDELIKEMPGLNIINRDFLEIDLNTFSNKKNIRIIGNIPYNLTSSILFKLFSNHKLIQDVLLMVQLEVANRMTAKLGSKDYGILSVLLSYFATTKICFKISPNVFYPKPKVWSAIVHIHFNKKFDESIKDEEFISVVKAAFGNRRKTLRNSLRNSIFKMKNIDSLSFPLDRRAEEFAVEDFIKLTRLIRGQQNGRRD